MRQECYQCHIKTVKKLIEKYNPVKEIADSFLRLASEILETNKNEDNPYLATLIHRLAKIMINHSDLYQSEKHSANKVLLENYSKWESMVKNDDCPLSAASKLAVAGNIIDYGAHSVPEDVEKQINTLYNTDLAIDETESLIKKIRNAKSVLYIGDNAGEIVFDKLFIEYMDHPDVTYVVRGAPVINDVTFDDIQQVKLDKICKIISNGFDAPSTLLEYCSDEFIRAFEQAGLIISKGQGNFEGLMNSGRPDLYFLLMAKCEPMAELLKVTKNSMVITRLKT